MSQPRYPIDPWIVRETAYSPEILGQSETIFALSNGYLGFRGNLDEPDPCHEKGTYLNGFFESRPILYPEAGYGYATHHQTMVNVTDAKILTTHIDRDPLDMRQGHVIDHRRILDMRTGVLQRDAHWESPAGKRVRLRSRRLVSMTDKHLAVIEYEIEAMNECDLAISSLMVPNESEQTSSDDPRESARLFGRVLLPRFSKGRDAKVVIGHMTRGSELSVTCGMDHAVEATSEVNVVEVHGDEIGAVRISLRARAGDVVTITKYIAYHWSHENPPEDLVSLTDTTLDRATPSSFDEHMRRHSQAFERFWKDGDVEVDGDEAVQQAVRFSQFQIFQATACAEGRGIPAKGLTGNGYDGHYFWDMEAFGCIPLTYIRPAKAKGVLQYRHTTLEQARARAEVLSQKGATYPWRTIDGEEASAFFAAGAAQYHINADIMYAVMRYVTATGDDDFLAGPGAEMLVETARLWADLGYFSDRHGGRFCIDEVTGPDEYNAMVNNNAYTNLGAQANLREAANTVRWLRTDRPEDYAKLVELTDLEEGEPDEWRRAADLMYIPYDDVLGVHCQDDSLLEKKPWNFEGTPPEKYPLLLHYHPLVIYRHKVIKQADLILAMFQFPDFFSPEEKRRNFEFYDPLTTGDSSLSPCTQAVIAAETGHIDSAYAHARQSALVDLNDLNRNVHSGIHIAAVAGTWIALVNGFGGLRQRGTVVCFDPVLPRQWTGLRFRLRFRQRRIRVDIEPGKVTYSLREGDPIEIIHRGESVTLAEEPVTLPTRVPPT